MLCAAFIQLPKSVHNDYIGSCFALGLCPSRSKSNKNVRQEISDKNVYFFN